MVACFEALHINVDRWNSKHLLCNASLLFCVTEYLVWFLFWNIYIVTVEQENKARNMASGKVHHSPQIATTFPLQEEVEDGKNRHLVKCQRCPSKILNPGMGIYKQVEFPLPHMKQKTDRGDISSVEEEIIKDCWVVEDMYSFENVGFSNSVAGVKYLACADCEVGPIGWFDITAQTSYVALSRVLHVSG